LRRLPQRRDVHHVTALKALLQIAEKLLRGAFVHVGQRVEKIRVEIFLRPLLRALNHVRQRDCIVLRPREKRTRQQN